MIRRLLIATAAAAVVTVAAPSVVRAQDIFDAAALSTPPKLASPPMAARLVARTYPEDLRRAGTSGTVYLKFVVGTDGKAEPGTIEADAPLAGFETAAKQVIQGIEFTPGKKGSQTVRARMEMALVYKP
ncbi:MAG: energy transducer TonB [Gemmatimonadaceae bacterium]|nr:energy transducer TonB [Gemmatimonadaceae bacterium]